MTGTLPGNLYEIVSREYQELAIKCGLVDPAVAMRSSALDEDGLNSSFVGQSDIYLNIKGPEAVSASVAKCWDSAGGERIEANRKEHNLPADSQGVAVLVQQLIPVDISGVVFSANPVSGSVDEVMINSTWGLGEGLVSGRVTPDTLIVKKSAAQIKDSYLGEKGPMTVLCEGGTEEVRIPSSQRETFTLDGEKPGR